jgi:hypothetical protein
MAGSGLANEELLRALEAGFRAGLPVGETLAMIARAGPSAARTARRIDEALRAGDLAGALSRVLQLPAEAREMIALGEELGRLPDALAWVCACGSERVERARAVRAVVVAPIVIFVLTILSEPLPAVVLGSGSFWPTLRGLGIGLAVVAAMLAGLRWMVRRSPFAERLRAILGRTPFVSSWMRLGDEALLAAILARFAEPATLGVAPRAARAVAIPAHAQALEMAATDPLTALPGLSEPLALVLATGLRTGELPARAAAVHAASEAKLRARLCSAARLSAWGLVVAAGVHAGVRLMSMQLPGLGGDLGNLPEMRELQRELDSMP